MLMEENRSGSAMKTLLVVTAAFGGAMVATLATHALAPSPAIKASFVAAEKMEPFKMTTEKTMAPPTEKMALLAEVETTPTEKMARLPAEKEDGPARCEDWCEEEEEETSNDLSNLDIVTKYRTSGDIANRALAAVAAACVPGAKAVDLCNIGDAYINEAVSKIYNQKKEGKKLVEKGVAFPTCVSVNNCVGHYSPLTSEDKVVLEDGDMVKIDLGVHVDGYVAVVAHTVLVGEQDVSGRKGDVLMAAWTAGEVAQRMLKDGATNNDISQAIAKVAESYQCSPVEGVLSHQMKKHVIDANKKIINKITPEQQVPKATITKNDVFAIDVVMSTGEGKPKQLEDRTTVFKRNVEVSTYSLKMKASRAFFSEVNQRFPTMPFTLRAGNEREWRMGVTECVKHDLFIEYPVLYEKKEEFVAQYKFTALLLPSNKTARITSGPAPTATSEHSVQDAELVELLAQSTEDKKKAKK